MDAETKGGALEGKEGDGDTLDGNTFGNKGNAGKILLGSAWNKDVKGLFLW